MGNGESVQEETVLQEQDSEHVWQLVRRDQDVDKGEDGCCLFITYPGKGTQAERCKNALQVKSVIMNQLFFTIFDILLYILTILSTFGST